MRNIVQYPITTEEVVETLSQSKKRYTDAGMYFGVHPYILNQLAVWIEEHPDLVDEIFGLKLK